ncbi:hypothetical protein AMTRI_Chr05g57050 [Amborella trichopoda]
MASIFATAFPAILCNRRVPIRVNGSFPQSPSLNLGRIQRGRTVVAMAAGDKSDSSSSSIIKSVQNSWNRSEDRLAIIGFGFAGVIAVWASSNIIRIIDSLPLIPSALEFIGILFSWWFIYRYLLLKPDREELLTKIKDSISEVVGE